MKAIKLIILPLLGTLLLSGCVVGRRTVSLPIPAGTYPASTKGEFVITSTSDERRFENKPSEPSTPSIDGDVTQVSKEQLASMIGRQRNGYGKAMGDIAMPAPESVPVKAGELIAEGLRRSGYSVAKSGTGPNTVDVKVNQFWAWFSPGMWSVGFEARIQCNVTLTLGGKTATIDVTAQAENRGQAASDANWQLAYNRAFEDFLKKFQGEIKKTGF